MVSLLEFEGSNWTPKEEKRQNIWYGVDSREKYKNKSRERENKSQKPKPTQGYRKKGKSKSPNKQQKNDGRCNWCRRPGHLYKDCWRQLGNCLHCGSDKHPTN